MTITERHKFYTAQELFAFLSDMTEAEREVTYLGGEHVQGVGIEVAEQTTALTDGGEVFDLVFT